MCIQQGFNLFLDFLGISQRSLLHSGDLCLVHIVHDAVYVGFQFGGVHHVQLIKLIEHHVLTLAHTALRRQTVEIFLEIPLFCAGHFEYLGQSTLICPHIDLGNLIIGCGKINVVCLSFQREAFGKLLFFQQFQRTFRKQGIGDHLEKLRDHKSFKVTLELRTNTESSHLFPHLPRKILNLRIILPLFYGVVVRFTGFGGIIQHTVSFRGNF